MSIEDWPKDIVLVQLYSNIGDELDDLIRIIHERKNNEPNVVIDFSAVTVLTASELSKLLKIRKFLGDYGATLTFCSVSPATKGIFAMTGLDGIFKIVDDKFVALAQVS